LRSLALLVLVACGEATPPPAAPAPPPPAALPIAVPAEPAPDAAPVTEGDVTIASARGMQIVVKSTPGAEFVGAELGIRKGWRDWTADNAGIENLALEVATSGGTQSLAKGPYSQKLAALGATISGGSGLDFSSITAKAPKGSWDDLFPVFVETFLSPALAAGEFDVVRQRELEGRRHELEDGDGRLLNLVRKALYAGHPYANRPDGTIENLRAMKAEDMSAQLSKLRDTSRLVLVVVGDVDPGHVIDQVKSAFATVPRGAYAETPPPQLHFASPQLATDSFKLPTNYVQTNFAGPAWNDPDFTVMRLGMFMLSERLFDEVRTKRNLSYAPSAHLERQGAPFGAMYVTAVDPSAAMKVIIDQAHRLQTETVEPKELEGAKSVYLSRLIQRNEAVNGQAHELLEAILLGGDWHLTKSLPERIHAVTPEAVRAAAKKWMVGMQTAIVGDPSKLDPKIVLGP
jgi:predicted Zn-dependent peptidase